MARPKDIFMQFASAVDVLVNAATHTVVEVPIATAMSVRGAFIWLVHQVEFDFEEWLPNTDAVLRMALSTRQGLAAVPTLDEEGVVAAMTIHEDVVSNGTGVLVLPVTARFLPPVPLATSELSFYFALHAHLAALGNMRCSCRVGFTTAELDAGAYMEIAEVWG
jgi:hypothetical protein